MTANAEKQTLLHCFTLLGKNTPSGIYLTQPLVMVLLKDYTWQQVEVTKLDVLLLYSIVKFYHPKVILLC